MPAVPSPRRSAPSEAIGAQPDEPPVEAMSMYCVTVGLGVTVTVAAACGRAVMVTVTVGRGCFVVGWSTTYPSVAAATTTKRMAEVTASFTLAGRFPWRR
jgi:hypothetical protein